MIWLWCCLLLQLTLWLSLCGGVESFSSFSPVWDFLLNFGMELIPAETSSFCPLDGQKPRGSQNLPPRARRTVNLHKSSLPGGSDGKESACNAGHQVWSWVRMIPWRRKWQPTPIFLPGEFHGWRNLAVYSLQGWRESDTTERLTRGSPPKGGPEIRIPCALCVLHVGAGRLSHFRRKRTLFGLWSSGSAAAGSTVIRWSMEAGSTITAKVTNYELGKHPAPTQTSVHVLLGLKGTHAEGQAAGREII